MSRWNLVAMALSPLHVGDGAEWTPDCFRLDGGSLLRFEPWAVVAGMEAQQQKKFLDAAARDDLKHARAVLLQAVRKEHVLDRIELSPQSRDELADGVENPDKRLTRVNGFIRTGGKPFIPGSAIKGSLRTALASSRAAGRIDELKRELNWEQIDGGRSGRASDQLQKLVLPLASVNDTDSDPFRFVRVQDAALPEGATRVEKVFNRRRDGKSNEMQMHFEAVRPGARFRVELEIDDFGALRRNECGGSVQIRRPIAAKELFAAANAFYRQRLREEINRFYADARMEGLEDVDGEGFPLLLRVGRFSHFESASVDGLGRGWRPQARGGANTAAKGSTRAVVKIDGAEFPFGWLALAPANRPEMLDAITWRSASAATVRGQQATVLRPKSLVGRRGAIDGERVEVVADQGKDFAVKYLDSGEIEAASREKFRPD